MSDRLKELQRQRALLHEHLAWLDREITDESGGARPSAAAQTMADRPGTPSTATKPRPVSPPSVSPAAASDATAAAEAILEKYQSTTPAVESEVKRGCFLYFFLALTLVGLGVFALYLYSVRK